MERERLLRGIDDEEERLLFARALDQMYTARKQYSCQFSDFTDAAKCARFTERLSNRADVSIIAFGGGEDCERLMIGFAPDTLPFSREDFPIRALSVKAKSKKFSQTDLSHRDFLGSVLGLGIDRGKIGDIIVSDGEAVVFVHEDIADYIRINLERVSRTAVTVSDIDVNNISRTRETKTVRKTVAALRLDAVLAEALNISRGKAQALIGAEKVSVNWTTALSASKTLKTGDMVSARGFGRFKVGEVGGKTRKDRIGLTLEIYI